MSEKLSGVNSTREPNSETIVSHPPSADNGRLPYRAPKLVRFGTLLELTQSGSGIVGESGVAKTRKPRPQS